MSELTEEQKEILKVCKSEISNKTIVERLTEAFPEALEEPKLVKKVFEIEYEKKNDCLEISDWKILDALKMYFSHRFAGTISVKEITDGGKAMTGGNEKQLLRDYINFWIKGGKHGTYEESIKCFLEQRTP